MKDVKEIHDIPNIEYYLDKDFAFVMFERGDSTIIYERMIGALEKITIDMNCAESLLESSHKLYDIITFEKIDYLQFTISELDYDTDESFVKEAYCYRPLAPEEDKEY